MKERERRRDEESEGAKESKRTLSALTQEARRYVAPLQPDSAWARARIAGPPGTAQQAAPKLKEEIQGFRCRAASKGRDGTVIATGYFPFRDCYPAGTSISNISALLQPASLSLTLSFSLNFSFSLSHSHTQSLSHTHCLSLFLTPFFTQSFKFKQFFSLSFSVAFFLSLFLLPLPVISTGSSQ